MSRTSNRTNKPAKAEVVEGETGLEARPVHTVVGQRVRPEKEKFVLVDAEGAGGESPSEVVVRCGSCGEDSSEAAWKDNDGDCPECDWNPEEDRLDDSRERLSEAELLFQMIEDEGGADEYVIKVDHLPNFPVDGKTNTTALKKFCRYLRGNEVTLDFMETVRRSCVCPCLKPGEEGRFLFTASQATGKGNRFKKRWDDSITKPLVPEEKAIAPTVNPAAGDPLRRTAREELMDVIDLAERLANIRNNGAQQQQTRELPPADPFKTAEASLSMLEKAKNLFDRGGGESIPAGGERTWLDGAATLVDKLGIGQLIAEGGKMILSETLRARREAVQAEITAAAAAHARRGPAEPPRRSNTTPSALPTAPPATEEQQTLTEDAAQSVVGPEEMSVLETVVREIRAFENDEDTEKLEERVATAVAAVRTLPAETLGLVNEIPPAFLLPYLIGLRPDWQDLAGMTDAGSFIGLMVEKLREEPEEGSGEVVTFPGSENEKEKSNGEPNEETETIEDSSNANANANAGGES